MQQGATEHFTDDFLDEPHRPRVAQQRGEVFAQDVEAPDLLVQVQADEPAEQQVVVELFVELLLAGHRIEQLQQEDMHGGLRCDQHLGTGVEALQHIAMVIQQVVDLRTQQDQ